MQPPTLPSLSALPAKYPLIYRAFYRNRRYPREPIAYWGIECGTGWLSIIDEFSEWLEHEARKLKASGKRMPLIVQVKAKFGTLRIYVRYFPRAKFFEELQPRISAAEQQSETVCEVCGHPGTLRRGGYMQTLCDEHEAEARSRTQE